MAEYDGISQYRKAAAQRLQDAEELLQPPSANPNVQGADTRHLRAAEYLAGYAVECILKVYIVSRAAGAVSLAGAIETRRAAGKQVPNLLSAEGYRLTVLLSLTDLEAYLTEDREKDWSICVKWKSTWRYDPHPPTMIFAAEFVAAARRIHQWVERQV